MSSQGNAYARFRRALLTGNLTIIDAAARELPQVGTGDALKDVDIRVVAGRAERHGAPSTPEPMASLLQT